MTTPKIEYLYNYQGQTGSVMATSPMAAQEGAGLRLSIPPAKRYLILVRPKELKK